MLPRIVFVLGKGGVGRSTVAAALGMARAARGERVLVLEWAAADVIGPWFGAPPVEATPTEIAPRLAVANFSLDEALRAYFVDHLHLGVVYRHVIRSRSVAHTIDVAPGLSEMFFLGQLWWLITLAEREAGLRFDRIVVDAPATGHGASIFDLPALLSTMGAAGVLAIETRRLAEMIADPARTGAIVVGLPEPMVVDETCELIPRLTARLGRSPLALIVNRSLAAIAPPDGRPAWLVGRPALSALADEVRGRVEIERALRARTQGAVAGEVTALDELPGRAPIEVVRAAAHALRGVA